MIKKKDLVIASYLRQNARVPLTRLARKIGMPVSTIFDRIRSCQGSFIAKQTALLNFPQLGFSTRATVLLKVRKESKECLQDYLMNSFNVNSLYKINNGYDFMAEFIFRSIPELENFVESIDEQFGVKIKEVHYILDDLKRETFLAQPELVDTLFPAC